LQSPIVETSTPYTDSIVPAMFLVPIPQISGSGARDGADPGPFPAMSEGADGRTARRTYANPPGRRHVPFVLDVMMICPGVGQNR